MADDPLGPDSLSQTARPSVTFQNFQSHLLFHFNQAIVHINLAVVSAQGPPLRRLYQRGVGGWGILLVISEPKWKFRLRLGQQCTVQNFGQEEEMKLALSLFFLTLSVIAQQPPAKPEASPVNPTPPSTL